MVLLARLSYQTYRRKASGYDAPAECTNSGSKALSKLATYLAIRNMSLVKYGASSDEVLCVMGCNHISCIFGVPARTKYAVTDPLIKCSVTGP